MGEGSLSSEDIDALLNSDNKNAGKKDNSNSPSFEEISAALGPEKVGSSQSSAKKSQNKSKQSSLSNSDNLDLLRDIKITLNVELGRTNKLIKDVLQLNEGSIVELDKNDDEDLDILANGKLVARGKLVLLNDFYGVQVTQVLENQLFY